MLDLFPPMLDGTLREHYLLLFGSAGAISVAVGTISAWVGATFGARRAVRRALQEAEETRTAAVDARLVEMSRVIEGIALDVERVTEGQRYTARMLTERLPRVPAILPPSAERGTDSVTPH